MPYIGPAPADSIVDTAGITDDAVTAAKIAANAVDSSEIAAGSVDIAHLSASGSAGSGNFLRGDNSWQTAGLTGVTTGSGNVTITSGNLIVASGNGVDFSATSDGTGTDSSELLDDYEEGSFSPTMYGYSTAGTPNYDVRGGYYTKIGQLVHFTLYIRMNSLTGAAGDLVIGGLPYTSNSNSAGTLITVLTDTVAWTNVEGGADYLVGNLWASDTAVGIMEVTDDAAWAYISSASSIASTDQIYLSGSYRV